MDTIKLNPTVQDQINTKELLHIINYFMENINLKGFDCLNILKMKSRDCEEHDTMVNQEFQLNIFFAPGKNVKVTLFVDRAKNWSCSQTCHKVTDTIVLS